MARPEKILGDLALEESATPRPEEAKGQSDEPSRFRIDPRAQEARKRYEQSRAANGGRFSFTAQQKLKIHDYSGQTIGHHVTWVNNYPGNVQNFLDRGYSPVFKTEGLKVGDRSEDYASKMDSWVSAFVGKDPAGQPLFAYLLKIPQAWYDEDRQTEQKRIDDQEKEIYGENRERDLNAQGITYRRDLWKFESQAKRK